MTTPPGCDRCNLHPTATGRRTCPGSRLDCVRRHVRGRATALRAARDALDRAERCGGNVFYGTDREPALWLLPIEDTRVPF